MLVVGVLDLLDGISTALVCRDVARFVHTCYTAQLKGKKKKKRDKLDSNTKLVFTRFSPQGKLSDASVVV